MKITVGSKNINKIQAVKDIVVLYPVIFKNAEVVAVDIELELFGHPKTLEETTQGAIERARKAFVDCDYSFGLEGGLMAAPETVTGYVEIGVCALYDGKQFYIGHSCSFEWPSAVLKKVLAGETDASTAIYQLGISEHKKIGAMPGGNIGFLTGGRITREEQTRQSIIMAMIKLEHPELYQ